MIRLEDIKKSKRFEDALKMSWRRFTRRLEDVLKTPWRLLGKTPWRCLEDVFKTSWRCLEDVFARCLKDVLKAVLQDAFWRRMTKANMFVLIKTCSEDEDKRVSKTSSRCLHQDECLVRSLENFRSDTN